MALRKSLLTNPEVQCRVNRLRGLADRAVYLYGAGVYALEVRRFLESIDVPVQGTILDDEYLRSPAITFESARQVSGNDFVCVVAHVSEDGKARQRAMERMGGAADRVVSIDCRFWMTHRDIDSATNLDKLDRLYSVLSDEPSRQTLVAWINTKRTFEAGALSSIKSSNQYFPPDLHQFQPASDDVVIDAGAYQGDTLLEFLEALGGSQSCKKYVAFEPDPQNIHELEKLQRRPDFGFLNVIPKGAWNTRTVLRFNASGTSRSEISADGTTDINVDTIDSYAIPATLIKMDIEGAELQALQGATQTLVTHRPRLAIAVYHSLFDLMKIPRFIEETCGGYHYFLRAHSCYSEELVLYASPAECEN